MNNEIFPLTLQTFKNTWDGNNTCDDNDNTFEIVSIVPYNFCNGEVRMYKSSFFGGNNKVSMS